MRLDLLALAAGDVQMAGREAEDQARRVVSVIGAREARWAAGALRLGVLRASRAADVLEDRADLLERD